MARRACDEDGWFSDDARDAAILELRAEICATFPMEIEALADGFGSVADLACRVDDCTSLPFSLWEIEQVIEDMILEDES